MGVCLPKSCTSLDVNRVVELSAREARLNSYRNIELVTIKSPHNEYIMTDDPVFYIVL